MPDWKFIDMIYLYDGTFEGLLTIVFDCFIHKTLPQKIVKKENYCPNFLDKTLEIETNLEKSNRILNGIVPSISYSSLYDCYYAFLSTESKKEITIVKYLYHGFTIGPRIHTMLSISYVFDLQAMRKKVFGECHRLKGLLRFVELENGIFYANIHPDNDILEPLGQHFKNRFPKQNFIIHDKNRNKVFLWNTKKYEIQENILLENLTLSEKESYYQKLWKTFFKTISISERTNLELQKQYMPKRYWKDLIEDPYQKKEEKF